MSPVAGRIHRQAGMGRDTRTSPGAAQGRE
jgi:hypothetical protein